MAERIIAPSWAGGEGKDAAAASCGVAACAVPASGNDAAAASCGVAFALVSSESTTPGKDDAAAICGFALSLVSSGAASSCCAAFGTHFSPSHSMSSGGPASVFSSSAMGFSDLASLFSCARRVCRK